MSIRVSPITGGDTMDAVVFHGERRGGESPDTEREIDMSIGVWHSRHPTMPIVGVMAKAGYRVAYRTV